MRNKDDPHTKAERILCYYLPIERELMIRYADEDYPVSIAKRLHDIQNRRAVAFRRFNIGKIWDKIHPVNTVKTE